MQITSASQQFAVAEQKTVAYGRKQQLLSKATTEPRPVVIAAVPAVADKTVPSAATPAAKEQPEQTTDDDQVFNAFQTVGMVKRILAQLSAHTKDWLDKPAVAEFSAKDIDSATFSVARSQQSLWLSTSQSQQNSAGQVMATEAWELGYQAVQASFSGDLQLSDGSSISFAFDFSMEISWARYSYTEQPLQDPLVVSLSGSPVQLSSDSSLFDLRSDGNEVKLPQLAAQQYYLAYDRNQDQQVNNGTELFGPRTGQGFAELAKFDDNGNGFIDPADDIWQYLYLWRPKQQLLSMTEAKLGAFSLSSAATAMPLLDKQQQKQGEIQRSGLAFTQDARPVLVQQIDLVV
jgi:hypothetical protein